MTWYNKEQPTPFDALLIEGLIFQDGDRLADQSGQDRTREHKNPLVAFPSGVTCALWESSDPEQVRALLNSEWEPLLRQALAPEGDGAAGQRTGFPVTSISREDLVRLDFRQEEIDQLTNEDMAWIARKIEDRYVESGFWEDLTFYTEAVLNDKDQE